MLHHAAHAGVVNDTTRRYLVAQRVVMPTSMCYSITTLLSPLINWLLIFRLGHGVEGAAHAMVACTALNAVLLTGYQYYRDAIVLAGSSAATWGGLSCDALRGWGQVRGLGSLYTLLLYERTHCVHSDVRQCW